MFINGELDYRYDSDYLAIPEGLTLDKKLVTAYEKAWTTFDDTKLKYEEAVANMNNAEGLDTLLLIAAVRAGEEHPGEPSKASATAALNYVREQLRQQATVANELAEQIRESVRLNPDTITAQAVELERASLHDLVDTYETAKELINAGALKARLLGSRMNWIQDIVQVSGRTRFNPTIPPVHFPSQYEFNIEFMSASIDTFAGTTENTPTLLVGGRNATTDYNGDKHNYR